MSLKQRMTRLEVARHARCQQQLQETAVSYGLTLDELLDEAHRFFALPLAAQLAEVDRQALMLHAEGFTAADLAHTRQVLIRDYRSLEDDQ